MEKRPNRSDQYQHLFSEIMYSHEMLSGFSNHEGISSRLCPYQYDEQLLDLQDRLKDEFWRVVKESLSERQGEIIRLIGKEGKTQAEAGKALQINQSSVNKQILGSSSKDGLVNNGSYSKLREAVFADPIIISILAKIEELQEEKW